MENIYDIYFSEGEKQNILLVWSLLQNSSRTCIQDLVDSTEFILFCIYISIISIIVIYPRKDYCYFSKKGKVVGICLGNKNQTKRSDGVNNHSVVWGSKVIQ